MIGKPQFSLRYMLGEVALFALAMGMTRAVYFLVNFVVERHPLLYPPPFSIAADVALPILALTTMSLWGAALGGLFGKMVAGAIWTPIVAFLGALLMPTVIFCLS
jgi:hypothetical protein